MSKNKSTGTTKETKLKPIHLVMLYENSTQTRIEFLNLLLSAGESINSQDNNGHTVLHLAACFSENEMIQFICEKTEINVFETDLDGLDAAKICQIRNN